ncbi:hypothetical protein O181_041261 [Austropuccinia psidii MF-1]|uniref:Reverse transcriptase Ty1/copia-type domain-containing protein n=1 Tax=Austropuccinia psidii MF-1 TaxID=1389203 RepID=A0A9Q3DJD3_9BASI|nr:hypothetical protein [Austropuccinia psidii MF-1]
MRKRQVCSPHEQNKSIHPLTATVVFKRKVDENENLTKYQAILCVGGLTQQEVIDYNNLLSTTGRLASLRLLLTLPHQHEFQISQMDVQWHSSMESLTTHYMFFDRMAARMVQKSSN